MTSPTDPQAGTSAAVDFDRARAFIGSEGRILERRLAQVHLDADRSAAPAVIAALRAHLNPDGGFGHALEPDARTPDSQPLFADFALDVLDGLAVATGDPDPARDLLADTGGYLAKVATDGGGVPIVLPTVAAHARAEHWGAGEFPAGLNPTAALAGRFRALGIDHPWVEDSAAFCWRQLEDPAAVADAHTALCVLRFLETEPDRGRAEPAYDALGARLGELALFQLWPGSGYGLTPLQFAPHPDSPRRRFFPDDAVEAHLDALAAAQQADGGWPISWDAPGETATREWRGIVTLGALRVLRAYGRA
ncbi:hypothetical protein ABZV93_13020 [Actinopolymorpha sp. NPDC004070]|uniref:hypothetical protein n=1 Tax=Actinopolymorpha sp. NPDC004070 TaxID=3154548 RepID=UPI0033BEC6C4